MSVADALRQAAQQLSDSSDTSRLDVELLMAHALGVDRSALLLRHMADDEPCEFAELVERRARCEPVAYILGEAEFFGYRFIVNSAVPIPRGDSECVVEVALETAPEQGRMLDLGTGSGALLLALLAERKGLSGVGIDASLAALSVAAANAAKLGIKDRARFLRGDWHEPGWNDYLGRFDLIIANPPYVETTAQLESDVRDFEPSSALFAGEDGLDDYHVMIPQLHQLLTEAGFAVLEIGASQAVPVTQIAENEKFSVRVRYDLANRPRALILR